MGYFCIKKNTRMFEQPKNRIIGSSENNIRPTKVYGVAEQPDTINTIYYN